MTLAKFDGWVKALENRFPNRDSNGPSLKEKMSIY